jgi:hypothetical protein
LDVDEIGLLAGTRGRQIAGRFTLIAARPFDYGTTGQRDTWRGLTSTMEARLRLHHHQPGTLTAGFARSGGRCLGMKKGPGRAWRPGRVSELVNPEAHRCGVRYLVQWDTRRIRT